MGAIGRDMVNKDYILRIAERFGRELAIILGLRKASKHEDALIYIDDLLLHSVGLTSSFINSVSDEVLLLALSPLGVLNIEKCLWVATLLKAEGEVYEELGNSKESYYRYLKALTLFLEVQLQDGTFAPSFASEIDDLLSKLSDYELPTTINGKLFSYYELMGHYSKAEDMLFELLAADTTPVAMKERGLAFYQRLQKKSDTDLLAGNFSRAEIAEGEQQLQNLAR